MNSNTVPCIDEYHETSISEKNEGGEITNVQQKTRVKTPIDFNGPGISARMFSMIHYPLFKPLHHALKFNKSASWNDMWNHCILRLRVNISVS